MSPSNRSLCHKRILKPLLFIASGVLLVIGNGAAIAHEKAEGKIAILNSQVSATSPLLAQTTPIPTVAPAEPVAQFSSSQNVKPQQIVQVADQDNGVEQALSRSAVLEATEPADAASISLRAADLVPNPSDLGVSTAADSEEPG
ncbi:MAG: hypothetical protein ACFB14_10960 [Leptolyngbyaceae cyanobacterium]